MRKAIGGLVSFIGLLFLFWGAYEKDSPKMFEKFLIGAILLFIGCQLIIR